MEMSTCGLFGNILVLMQLKRQGLDAFRFLITFGVYGSQIEAAYKAGADPDQHSE